MAKVKGQIPWYQYKDLFTRNAHVQYESSNFHYFVINNRFFKNMKRQGQKVSYQQKEYSYKI